MNKYNYLLLLCAFFALSFAATEWKSYRNIEGRFKVLSKGLFEERSLKAQTAIGDLTTFSFIHQPETPEENLVYMITYYDFPEGTMHEDSTELLNEFFQSTIEQAAASVKGVKIYESAVTHQTHRAWQWRVDYAEGKVAIKTRAFLVGRRFYSIQTVGLTDAPLEKSTEFFINSFQVLGE